MSLGAESMSERGIASALGISLNDIALEPRVKDKKPYVVREPAQRAAIDLRRTSPRLAQTGAELALPERDLRVQRYQTCQLSRSLGQSVDESEQPGQLRLRGQSYKEYQMAAKRENQRRKVSLQVKQAAPKKKRFGFLTSKEELYSALYPQHLRRSKMRWRATYGVGRALLTLYVAGLVWTFWQAWSIHCIRQLNEWLLVYLVIEVLHTITSVCGLVIWGCARDPSLAETRLSAFVKIFIYLAEAAWVIYGNTFIYSDDINQCDATTELAFGNKVSHVDTLIISTKVLIIFGYVLLLRILCICVIACIVFRVYQGWCRVESKLK